MHPIRHAFQLEELMTVSSSRGAEPRRQHMAIVRALAITSLVLRATSLASAQQYSARHTADVVR